MKPNLDEVTPSKMKIEMVEEIEPTGEGARSPIQEQSEWLTRDGCPITPGPWTVRAATFCDDGIPSFEVVMPGRPHMSAVDARIIGAAPALYEALKESALAVHTIGAYHNRVPFEQCKRTICIKARAALALVDGPTTNEVK